MKRKLLCAALAAMMLAAMIVPVSAYKVGDKVSSYAYTDIVTYINDTPIESFNINWETAVIVEDLVNYGFNVAWDPGARTLKVTRSAGKPFAASYKPAASGHKNGDYAGDVLYTDIVTYFDGKKVESFNINGRTIVYVNDIADFYAQPGTYRYDNAKRTLSLSLGGSSAPAPAPAPAPTPSAALRITSQPANVSATVGSTVSFKVAVTGGTAPYSYKWEIRPSSDIIWSDAECATSEYRFTATDTILSRKYVFRCVVTDAAGATVTSTTASLTTQVAALKATVTADAATVTAGGSATFRVNVTGGVSPYQYTWFRYNSINSQWVNVGTSQTNAFTLMNVNGLTYVRCEVYDSVGTKVTSDYATVNVATPMKVTVSAAKSTVAYNGSTDVTASVSGGTAPYTYTWYRYYNGQWYNQGTTNSSTTTVSNIVADTTIRCEVTDAAKNSVFSGNLVIKTADAMKVVARADSASVPYGSNASVSVSVTGGAYPYTYTWYRYYFGQWVNMGSTTYNTYDLGRMTEDAIVRCEVKDIAGNQAVSNEVTVKVSATMYATATPSSSTVGYGDSAYVTVSVDGGTYPYTYRWYQYYSGQFVQIGETSTNRYDMAVVTETVNMRCTVIDTYGNETTTNTVTIQVDESINNMQVEIDADTLHPFYGGDVYMHIYVDGGKYPYTYRWFVSIDGGAFKNEYNSRDRNDWMILGITVDEIKVYCEVVDVNGNVKRTDTLTFRTIVDY